VTVVLQEAAVWLDAALRSLPTQRADGVVTVTDLQITKFALAVRSYTQFINFLILLASLSKCIQSSPY